MQTPPIKEIPGLPSITFDELADLDQYWHYNETFPVRWVLDPTKQQHCEACRTYAREFRCYGNRGARCKGAEPGYFPDCVEKGKYLMRGDRMICCGDACRCHLEIRVNRVWHLLKRFP